MAAIDPAIAQAVKDKAEALFSKGKYADALDTYEKIAPIGDKDPRIYLRMGDIARKIDDNQRAIGYYKSAADSFSKLGFLIKAIAVCKVIISIDPEQKEVQAKLAQMCAKQQASDPMSQPAAPPRPKPQEPQIQVPKAPLFSDLAQDEFIEVMKKLKSKDYLPGTYIFKEGAEGDSIFIVVSGLVEVVIRKDGLDTVVANLKDGDFFGEFGFFSGSKRSSGVRAAEKTALLELAKADMNEIIKSHPRVAEVLLEFFKERVVGRLMAMTRVFEPMHADDRKAVLQRVSFERFGEGSSIIKEGELGDKMYLIKDGRVTVSVRDKLGTQSQITELKEGDFFGEIGLATNRPRVASVSALTEVNLVVFSRPMIKDILGKYPEIKSILEKVIKERVVDVMKARERAAGILI